MNSHNRFNERKTALLDEYISESKSARRGKTLVELSLLLILVFRVALALFEIPVFIIQQRPINLLAILLIFPLIIFIYIIYKGAKGFGYVILISSAFRLILYFSLVYRSMPKNTLTEVYSVTLFAVLLIQFFLSIIILVSYDCDTYFTAIQRINIKVHGEELLREKAENKRLSETPS